MPANPTPRKPMAVAKQAAKINRLALKHSERALAYVAATIDDATASHAVRLRAAEIILDRSLGKPKSQTEVNVSGEVNIQHLHLDALQAMAQDRLERYASGDESKLAYAAGEVIEHRPAPAPGPAAGDDSGDQDGYQGSATKVATAASLGLGGDD